MEISTKGETLLESSSQLKSSSSEGSFNCLINSSSSPKPLQKYARIPHSKTIDSGSSLILKHIFQTPFLGLEPVAVDIDGWRSLSWYLLGTGGTSSGSSFKTSFLFKRVSPTAPNADIKLLPSHFHAICFIIYWEVILILPINYLGTWFCSLLKWITKFPSVVRSLLNTMVALIVWHLQAYK